MPEVPLRWLRWLIPVVPGLWFVLAVTHLHAQPRPGFSGATPPTGITGSRPGISGNPSGITGTPSGITGIRSPSFPTIPPIPSPPPPPRIGISGISGISGNGITGVSGRTGISGNGIAGVSGTGISGIGGISGAPNFPGTPAVGEMEWECERCGKYLGRGSHPPSKCPHCGVILVNGFGNPDPSAFENRPGGPFTPSGPSWQPPPSSTPYSSGDEADSRTVSNVLLVIYGLMLMGSAISAGVILMRRAA